ncbi:hypothetical protein [Microvirga calopogonii]|uniref:hypothetical protein n=1 Tax=Microvirga calopogonii TaxID=2078013 RepID=UPI000E0E0300|nr:hypothetical protein [Microvirga calopogonii]
MSSCKFIAAGFGLLAFSASSNLALACTAQPVYLHSARFEAEGDMTVNAGKSCLFNINGIPGALEDVQIVQQPKVGRAGVQNMKPYYIAKPGYAGRDEFSYAFIGKDQYGGPMRIVIKRIVTVQP